MTAVTLSNNCSVTSLADGGLLCTSVGPLSSSSSHTVTVVTNSRHSLTDSVGHCVDRPTTAADAVRLTGNCVAPSSSPSLSNHSSSSALRALGPVCASTAVSFTSAPLLKSAGSAIHRMENVSRLLTSDFIINTVIHVVVVYGCGLGDTILDY